MAKVKLEKIKRLKVNVPAGVDTGNVIPLRGQGEPGNNGGPTGDLYINIRVASILPLREKALIFI